MASQNAPQVYAQVPPANDLKCYASTTGVPSPPVRLEDKFGSEEILPGRLVFLCTSVIKTVPPRDSDQEASPLHWTVYQILTRTDPPPIVLTDQFGQQTVDPQPGIAYLFVPAIKFRPNFPPEGTTDALHFKCYDIQGTIDPPPVGLDDQFFFEPNDPSNADNFCTPVIKTIATGESFGSLRGPDLIGYPILPRAPAGPVSIQDQFTRILTPQPIPTFLAQPFYLYTLGSQRLVSVEEGRMTGGGGAEGADVSGTVRVIHGFELHCSPNDLPNNLEVNWGDGNNFHLDTLTSATCRDDPNKNEAPPVAGFDTYIGLGTGTCNGMTGATASWTFTDEGEPGRNDDMTINITCGTNTVTVASNLEFGNHQAHPESE